MLDSCGRVIDYLRISVTDRCNLRCVYCLPEDGCELTEHSELLTFDEIIRICRNMAGMGLHKIKLTGGEPLIRKNLKYLVKELKNIPGIESVTLTTNAVLLKKQMADLANAGIDAINISLDTLDPELFKKVTRFDMFEQVMEGIQEALKYPDVTLKINCVPLGLEEQNLAELAGLAKEHHIHVRFIEMMPIGLGKSFQFQSEDVILKELEAVYGKSTPSRKKLGNGPCHYYAFDGFCGKIGFISALSHKFCGECNRVRLTSTGFLKTCLQFDTGDDLKIAIRSGCSDEELKLLIAKTINEKPNGHRFLEEKIDEENSLGMSQIGG